ncbi:hypothetical protein EVAR_18340_1 [Eumeta japonica]|uniref:Uncharacterized protein n=1 Tax=Eumeta variegata TaxID=151549 RepID=A0A4C1VC74_EUMVA|nr:hypothetical protein EVAR_18340_1 [Eumeta japonica]
MRRSNERETKLTPGETRPVNRFRRAPAVPDTAPTSSVMTCVQERTTEAINGLVFDIWVPGALAAAEFRDKMHNCTINKNAHYAFIILASLPISSLYRLFT